jgi:hypothetical protein
MFLTLSNNCLLWFASKAEATTQINSLFHSLLSFFFCFVKIKGEENAKVDLVANLLFSC